MKDNPGIAQETASPLSRRDFIKMGTASGITLYLATPGLVMAAGDPRRLATASYGEQGASHQNYRIDGVAKVTGQKIFARDIRARDMPNWPQQQSHALILRLPFADRSYRGLDLGSLPADAKPDRVLTARDLQSDGVDFPPFYTKNMLLPEGLVPPLLGQAVAILIFRDYARFHAAKAALQFRKDIFLSGEPIVDNVQRPWGAVRSVRVAGSQNDLFNALNDGLIRPTGFDKDEPVWPVPHPHGNAASKGMIQARNIKSLLDAPPPDLLVMQREYTTPSTDAVTLETESANIWYDAKAQALHMVVSVQNPREVLTHTADMLRRSAFPVRAIYLTPSYTVSYGAKDSANHTYYALVAALYGSGQPVRTVLDRYENFQAALKRHPMSLDYTIAVDRATGRFRALKSQLSANGGGRPSFSNVVVQESAVQASGIYDFDLSDLSGIAKRTKSLDASAIRGFGNLQTMSGLEMLVDEVAITLGRDPIDLRIQNAIRTGRRNAQGGVPSGRVRIVDVLEKARSHPLWTERAQRKAEFEAQNPNQLFGTGFACAQKNFGTGAEAAFAKVEIDRNGRLDVYHCGVETGTGLATTQSHVCREHLGRSADMVETGFTDWRDIPIVVTGNAYANTQAFEDQEKAKSDWSPHYVSSSGATNTAYYFTHVTREASRIIFAFGVWPAALALWGLGSNSQASTERPQPEEARWVNGHLTARGMEPLAWNALVAKMYELETVTGAAVHSFNRWQWAEADYAISPQQSVRLPLDGVSVRYGQGRRLSRATPNLYTRILRRNIAYPPVKRYRGGPRLTSAVGAIVALAVNKVDGAVTILNHHMIVECGRVMVEQLADGQVRGATAMSIGYALYEELPQGDDGPGNGEWNLDRYRIPRMVDVAPWSQTVEFLPPLSETDPPKGFSEAAIIPLAPAIGNAIAHATGQRLRQFPMTAERIKEILP